MRLVFLLEERSMKEFLDGLLQRILPDGVSALLIPHEGKSDLERSIPRKLKAWREPDARFVVIRDQDRAQCWRAQCRRVKAHLVELCDAGGKEALVRIACHELEAWFLGDPTGLGEAFGDPSLARLSVKRRFRDPDGIQSPSRELSRLVPGYGKVAGARRMGAHLAPERCASESFRQLLSGIERTIGRTLRGGGR